ncbi:ATP-dependent endonuclease [Shewanella sp. 10N.286.52.A9]|uniref:ATP-dependent nuclease n=1 Tax=Shewanella sp. 10N.286.52.A9 TaxID=3229711 RepID=UPI0035510D9A
MDYITTLERRGLKVFDNYIEQIRFPFFKKISRNQAITFDFPFTALVGPNGSGKSSVLQALFGATSGNSVSDFWFSTNIDPIVESGSDINRFIYKFKPKGYKKSVEILNKRTQRSKTANQNADPDYWESARPAAKDGMEKMPPFLPKDKNFRSETRWKAVEKDVTYIDFRSEISAFDKSFYFGDFEARPTIRNKKDFLRHRSNALNSCITSGVVPSSWHSKTLKKLRELSPQELEWTNKILGKDYLSAKILLHDFFNQSGFSIIFSKKDQSYSEAVAGSGEVAVVTSVIKILRTKAHSLILLDEPEVSLHPGAQLKLRELLLYKATVDFCQIVISTHSETFLQKLPNKAIKLFYLDEANGTYSVASEASPDQAFFRLGGKNDNKSKVIYVEDDLAKLMIEKAISEIDKEYLNELQILPHPGGAHAITKNLTVNFALSNPEPSSCIVILDGDMRRDIVPRHSVDIPVSEYGKLNSIIEEQIGISGQKFPLPPLGGKASKEIQEQQRNSLLLKVLDSFHKHFNYLNTDTPEELIWEVANNTTTMKALCQGINAIKYKDKFKDLADKVFSKTDASSILLVQEMMLNNRDLNHDLWIEFKDLLKGILQISDID